MNLYRITTEFKDDDYQEQLLDLDNVMSIYLMKKKHNETEVDEYVLRMEYTPTDKAAFLFKTEEALRAELVILLQAMGQPAAFAKSLVIRDGTQDNVKKKAKLAEQVMNMLNK